MFSHRAPCVLLNLGRHTNSLWILMSHALLIVAQAPSEWHRSCCFLPSPMWRLEKVLKWQAKYNKTLELCMCVIQNPLKCLRFRKMYVAPFYYTYEIIEIILETRKAKCPLARWKWISLQPSTVTYFEERTISSNGAISKIPLEHDAVLHPVQFQTFVLPFYGLSFKFHLFHTIMHKLQHYCTTAS